MHDTLDYFKRDSVYRKYHQNDLTFAMLYHHHENFILPLSTTKWCMESALC